MANTASVPSYEYTEQHFRELMGQSTLPRLFDEHEDTRSWEEVLDDEAAMEEQERIIVEQNSMMPDPWEWVMNPDGKPNPNRGFYLLPNGGACFID